MFSLLSPIAFWLISLAAIPILLHLIGYRKPSTQFFPSLLLIRQSLAPLVQRNRFKNLLLLIIRILIILCLLLALSNPIFQAQSALPGAGEPLIAFKLNTVYANLAINEEKILADLQVMHYRQLDTLTHNKVHFEHLIPSAKGIEKAAERYGDMKNLIHQIEEIRLLDPLVQGAVIPIVNWNDLVSLQFDIEMFIKAHPKFKLYLIDYSSFVEGLNPWKNAQLNASSNPENNLLKWSNSPLESHSNKLSLILKTWSDQSSTSLLKSSVWDPYVTSSILLPKSESNKPGKALFASLHFQPLLKGFLNLPFFVVIPSSGASHVIHIGPVSSTLASFGKSSLGRKVEHFPEYNEMVSQIIHNKPDLVFLSTSSPFDAHAANELVNYVDQGGNLILSVGEGSDLSLLNRSLLQPLDLGRILAPQLLDSNSVTPNWTGFNQAGSQSPSWLDLQFRTYKIFEWQKPKQAIDLLTLRGKSLAWMAKSGKGQVLLWTSDPDDPRWTEIGTSATLSLIHLNFEISNSSASRQLITLSSDSSMVLSENFRDASVEKVFPPGNISQLKEERVKVHNLRIGPFSECGVYRITGAKDSLTALVNLKPDEKFQDWQSFKLNSPLLSSKLKILTTSDFEQGTSSSQWHIWRILTLLAIILILLESVVSRVLGQPVSLRH